MTKQNVIIVGVAGFLFVLVALFTPVGALFLAGVGVLAFLIYKLTHPQSE